MSDSAEPSFTGESTWGIGHSGVGFIALVNVLLASGVTIHAVLWKRDSRSVIGWVGLAWLAPILGVVLYLGFGINRIHRKAASLRLSEASGQISQAVIGADEILRLEEASWEYPNLAGLALSVKKLTGETLLPGNEVQPLINGDEAFPVMIEAIQNAQRSVTLQSYIFDSDRSGERFLQALVDAVARGVQVRVNVDDVGSKYSRPNMVSRLQEAGVTSTSFLPTRIPRLPTTANLRNHRKILVVDGQLGFTGGTNIRDSHCLELEPSYPVQCLHFQIRGPVVAQLQQVFAIDWQFATGEELQGDPWFPSMTKQGPVWARGIAHGPDEDFEKLAYVLEAGLTSARERIRILSPYFLPTPSLIGALNVAALRGIDVEVYLPEFNNIALVHWAATAQLWQVLEKGCRVYYTPPPFDHTKLMVVDNVWTLLGSTNWDPRSLRLNFEFNVECYNRELARTLNEIIDRKTANAREVTLDDVDGRSFAVRIRDGLARLLTPYL